jgi:hypothetical protein
MGVGMCGCGCECGLASEPFMGALPVNHFYVPCLWRFHTRLAGKPYIRVLPVDNSYLPCQ